MSTSADILAFLKQKQFESDLQKLLNDKGYSNPRSDDFGLNKWTSQLSPKNPHFDDQGNPDKGILPPKNLVSFLAIPVVRHEDLVDTNSSEIRGWIADYKWLQVHNVGSPFPSKKLKACREGILISQPMSSTDNGLLELYLLLQRDGVVEFGLGGETYYKNENEVIFLFIEIMERFLQFLAFINDLFTRFYSDNSNEIICLLNLRGTENALLGNLAEGWVEPLSRSFDSYRPKCPDKNLQIHRTFSPRISADDTDGIVHWFATRIDNTWGQFEPRCYVHKDRDPARPFAFRKPK